MQLTVCVKDSVVNCFNFPIRIEYFGLQNKFLLNLHSVVFILFWNSYNRFIGKQYKKT